MQAYERLMSIKLRELLLEKCLLILMRDMYRNNDKEMYERLKFQLLGTYKRISLLQKSIKGETND